MHTTNLRKVGGSVMLAVPPAILDVLHLTAGTKVGISVDNGRLVIEPAAPVRYPFRPEEKKRLSYSFAFHHDLS
ncbi:hypothetical protein ACI01nite_25580 [Acetobacter cibinongensis]|uniref:Plasmid stable inheritance protein I n=1 Tax=Acetobacter cibinongensis TaxID=146475 RepID=A0A0D6N6N5_9PROT|nr:AbrB/MazE/SpoVT family DNA-binding domain-containing protein [Acetobacter cibinongensis]GAN61697.1 plasmid stable inheritance protein I [Acetobacter cibinongensis]GBQ15528.1 plasmid stable inheritance protein I [Acetobacter cibinongensis NRIC 0482]GEL59956.1 hypothetical protein ACI01nite_25580 [Acetobacter cibinongensis]